MEGQIAPIAPEERGNTRSPFPSEPSTKKQICQRIKHFFTYNNYKKEDIEPIEATFNTLGFKWAMQSEIGEKCGTPHLHGCILLKKKMRDTEFNLPKQIHWESVKDWDQCIKYCLKDETHDGFYRKSKGISIIKYKIYWNTWNTWLYNELVHTEPDNRTINWIWSKKGKLGKTNFTRMMIEKHSAVYASGGKYTDVMNLIYHTDMDTCNCVIFGMPKHHTNISYSALESIKDGLVSNMKSFKNGSKIFNPPHVIVFANFPPNKENLMEDRWNILNIDFMNELLE